MLKLFGAMLIVLACGYAGFAVARRYQRRPKDLRYIQGALQMLETEITYGATPLPEAFDVVSKRCEKGVAVLFATARDNLLTGDGLTAQEAWDDALKVFCQHSAINAGDVAILKALGAGLGISDRADQVKHLHLAREQLRIEAIKAEDEATKYVKLYHYLGFLGGLTIVIIFI